MKIRKLFFSVLVVGFVVGGISFNQGMADEKRVFIPDEETRERIITEITANGGEVVENETPTVSQMESITELNLDGGNRIELGDGTRSIEGIDYAKNVKTIRLSDMVNLKDYRPLGEMTNLESLYIFHGADSEEFLREKEIGFVENLASLKVFSGDYPVLDLTPFNNLDHLNRLYIMTNIRSSTKLSVSGETKSVTIANPVTYSKQFSKNFEQEIYDANNSDVLVSGENITISNIPEGVEELELLINASSNSEDGYNLYNLRLILDVVWY